MMPHITKHDREMMKNTDKWMYMDVEGVYHLRDDAPEEIKKHHKKMKEIYKDF